VAALVAALLVAGPTTAAAQTIEAGEVRVRLLGQAQVQFNTTSVTAAEDAPPLAGSTFETRRVRWGAEVAVSDWITGKFEHETALGRLRLTDVFMNLAVDPRLQLRVGQFKKPFSLLELTSSTRLLTMERGVRIRGLEQALPTVASFQAGAPLFGEEQALVGGLGYAGRDLGAALHGALGRVGYEVGVFNGTGPDRIDHNDGKAAAARLRWRAAPGARPLALGAAASYREVLEPATAAGTTVDGVAWEVDLHWGGFRRPGLQLQAELALGDNLATGGTFTGAHAVAGYFRPRAAGRRVEGWEPVLRASRGDPDRSVTGDEGWLLTPGLNLYFHGRNRVLVNWDVYLPAAAGARTQHAFRAQTNLVL
jgi:hypothetical protein